MRGRSSQALIVTALVALVCAACGSTTSQRPVRTGDRRFERAVFTRSQTVACLRRARTSAGYLRINGRAYTMDGFHGSRGALDVTVTYTDMVFPAAFSVAFGA